MRRVFISLIIGLMAISMLAPLASAQDAGFDAQLFRPSIFGGTFHAIEGVPNHWNLCGGVGLYLNYAASPMEIRAGDDFDRGVLNAVASANVIGHFDPWWWMALGVDVPVHLYTRGYEFEDPTIGKQGAEGLQSDAMLGDIKAELKFTALRLDQYPVGLALAPFATFPTGNPAMFLGEGTTNFGGKLLMEINAVVFNIGLNGGYLYREERDVLQIPLGSSYLYGAGIGRDFDFGLGFSVEMVGSYLDTASIEVAPGTGQPEEVLGNPMEVMAFLRYQLPDPVKVRIIGGGGSGITSGIGAPSYRMVAALDWHPDCIPPDKGTLIVDVVSSKGAPLEAALIIKKQKTGQFKTDKAGHFEREASPGEYKISAASKGYKPGTASGTVIAGDVTNVKVVLERIPDPTKLVVKVVHKKTGKPIANAGVMIKNLDTGKFVGYKAPEGVYSSEFPAGKYMFTGISKGYERVDLEGEVIVEQETVIVIPLRRKIMKIGKVQFAFDSAQLLPPAYPVLDDVVTKIKEADFIFKKVIIEGHTSQEGSDEYNMKLSKRRAASVKKYLSTKGISVDLLEIAPFGESRPIAPDTEEGREINRRVEFIFEE